MNPTPVLAQAIEFQGSYLVTAKAPHEALIGAAQRSSEPKALGARTALRDRTETDNDLSGAADAQGALYASKHGGRDRVPVERA